MYSIYQFSNLLAEIELCKIRIEHLNYKKEMLLKTIKGPTDISAVDYSKVPGETSKIDFVRASEELNLINFKLQNENDVLNELMNVHGQYNSILKSLEGKEYKIAYMRLIEKKAYKDIAEELYLNENYVRQIGSKLKLKLK